MKQRKRKIATEIFNVTMVNFYLKITKNSIICALYITYTVQKVFGKKIAAKADDYCGLIKFDTRASEE